MTVSCKSINSLSTKSYKSQERQDLKIIITCCDLRTPRSYEGEVIVHTEKLYRDGSSIFLIQCTSPYYQSEIIKFWLPAANTRGRS